MQFPSLQLGLEVLQTLPHPPQLKGSDTVSTHSPEQRVRPAEQVGAGTVTLVEKMLMVETAAMPGGEVAEAQAAKSLPDMQAAPL